MKKFFAGLTMLTICSALNFGLINDAQAAELDSSSNLNEAKLQFLMHPMKERFGAPPPPPPPHPYHGDWRRGHRPSPPPPPPPPRW